MSVRVPDSIGYSRASGFDIVRWMEEGLIDKGEQKLFYLKISAILRHYVEDRFGMHAPENTTEEFLRDLQKDLRQVKMKKIRRIEKLGVTLRNYCTLPGPALILLIAILLGVRRSVMKRHYISHASDS